MQSFAGTTSFSMLIGIPAQTQLRLTGGASPFSGSSEIRVGINLHSLPHVRRQTLHFLLLTFFFLIGVVLICDQDNETKSVKTPASNSKAQIKYVGTNAIPQSNTQGLLQFL